MTAYDQHRAVGDPAAPVATADRPVVFLAGSRVGVSSGRLPNAVRDRVGTIVRRGMRVVIGDANGADRALQMLLRELGHKDVSVIVGGTGRVRNLADPDWPVERIGADSPLTGKALMTIKDEAMGERATHGLMVWSDVYTSRFGRESVSSGTLRNVWQLLSAGKPVALFYVPAGRFFDLKSLDDYEDLVLPLTAPIAQRYWRGKLVRPGGSGANETEAPAQETLPGL